MLAQENAAVKPQPFAQNDGKREKKSEFFTMLSAAVEQASHGGKICDEKLAYTHQSTHMGDLRYDSHLMVRFFPQSIGTTALDKNRAIVL